MFSFASLLLLGMAAVTAALVAFASRALLRGEHARGQPAAAAFGLRLALSIGIAIAALWLFGEVADNVIDQDKLAQFDARVLVLLAPWRTQTGLAIANVVSRFGTSLVMSVLALVVLLTLYRRNWRAVAVGWTLVFGGGKLVEALLKHTLHRTRPIGAMQHLSDPSYSYPSGHAMGAMIGYGMLAYMVLRRVHQPAARAAVTTAAALIILAVGLSRLVLAVHYFTDVVGGYAAGAVWLALSLAAVEAARDRFVAASRGNEHRQAA
jgi:membrane-associated phospholipid phosphatase